MLAIESSQPLLAKEAHVEQMFWSRVLSAALLRILEKTNFVNQIL